MSVHVRLSTTLRKYLPNYEPAAGLNIAADGLSADDLAKKLGLPLEEIKFVMINGRQSPMQMQLRPGDRVSYFPAVGGG